MVKNIYFFYPEVLTFLKNKLSGRTVPVTLLLRCWMALGCWACGRWALSPLHASHLLLHAGIWRLGCWAC
jgi:hypothetical protein